MGAIGMMLVQLAAETIGRLLTTGALEWGMLWAGEKLAKKTESEMDDEFVALMRGKLGWNDDGQKAEAEQK